MNEPKLKALLGFAQKSGKLVSGENGVESALRSKKAKLLLLAADAAANTKKDYSFKAQNYQTVYKEVLTKEELGECIGKNYRAAVAVVDKNFAEAILALLSIQEDI
ncbi:MAG: ribosomal L7Ae/L30e/S12e/Gadd45 family protein [Sporomusaceae bacterium]|jgi:ribosomal protein L7Ae-like RNA K-turn-binding protein|nr:ribosomal L7Ae/L30e/S12e/Gadd45 family protein [Sporomusaceae bacterium]